MNPTEKVISGVFALATLALVLVNWQNVSQIIRTGGQGYNTFVKGLQGR